MISVSIGIPYALYILHIMFKKSVGNPNQSKLTCLSLEVLVAFICEGGGGGGAEGEARGGS